MLKFNDLLFNKWILTAFATLLVPNVVDLNPTYLRYKLRNSQFLEFCENNVLVTYEYGLKSGNLFTNFPFSGKLSYYERYLETTPIEYRIKDEAYLKPIEWVVLGAFQDTLLVGIYLPIFLTDFFKYYPCYKPEPLIFAEIEFKYLDCGIQILPVFQDFLGHLLINDTPLVEQSFHGKRLFPISLMPPIEKDINFSEHIREFYFGEDSIPEFKDVITSYLNNRLELKKSCEKAGALDNQLNSKIPTDLSEYFISCFLIKSISKYTLRFVVANLDLSNKNPMKVVRDASVKEGNALSEDKKKKYGPEGGREEQKK